MDMDYQLGMTVKLKADPGWGVGTIVECTDGLVGVRYKDGRLVRFEKAREELVEVKNGKVRRVALPPEPEPYKTPKKKPVIENVKKEKVMDPACLSDAVEYFSRITPKQLYGFKELKECPPPHYPGVYAWYFSKEFLGLPQDHNVVIKEGGFRGDKWKLMYIGIGESIYNRLMEKHFEGTAVISSLRWTLGCLLIKEIGMYPISTPGGSSKFSKEGKLSEWIQKNARVTFFTCESMDDIEKMSIRQYQKVLYFNTEHNPSKFQPLIDLKKNLRELALPENVKPNKKAISKAFKLYRIESKKWFKNR